MKKIFNILSVLFFICSILSLTQAFAKVTPPRVGNDLPDIVLSTPEKPEFQQYLGITGNTFKIPQIRSKLVLVEIFSMYCPYCQKDAPVVNSLYDKIQKDEEIKDKIKLIGIGAGNSNYEVNFFRKTYNIKFPLFADADFSIHKKLGEVRTPYFIGIKIKKDGTYSIIYSKRGSLENSEKFLKLIRHKSGL